MKNSITISRKFYEMWKNLPYVVRVETLDALVKNHFDDIISPLGDSSQSAYIVLHRMIEPKRQKINTATPISDRKKAFAEELKPYLPTYGKDLLNDFYKYWVEPNQSNTKFRKEMEKTWDTERRLETWAKRDKTFQPQEAKREQSLYPELK